MKVPGIDHDGKGSRQSIGRLSSIPRSWSEIAGPNSSKRIAHSAYVTPPSWSGYHGYEVSYRDHFSEEETIMRILLSVALLLPMSACYVYVPIGSAIPESGEEIRAHLSPARDFDVGTVTVRDVARIDGIVYETTDSSVAVWTSWLYSAYGSRFGSQHAVYYLPRHQVANLEVRRLQPARSAIGIGVGIGLTAAFLNLLTNPGGNQGSGGKIPPIVAHIAGPHP